MTQHAVAMDMMETRNHVDRTHRFALVTGMRDGNGFICIVRGPDSINIEGFISIAKGLTATQTALTIVSKALERPWLHCQRSCLCWRKPSKDQLIKHLGKVQIDIF